MTSDGLVYKIQCLPTGRAYIGYTSRRADLRWREHERLLDMGRHHAPILQRAWVKHGRDAFSFTVIASAIGGSRADLEQQIIDQFLESNSRKDLLNAKARAEPSVLFTDEVRAKMSVSRRRRGGNSYTEAQKKRISAAKMGMPLSGDHKAALRKAAQQRVGRFSVVDRRLMIFLLSCGASARLVARHFRCHHKTVMTIARSLGQTNAP